MKVVLSLLISTTSLLAQFLQDIPSDIEFCCSAKPSTALVYDVSGPSSSEDGAYPQTHEVLGTAKLPVFVDKNGDGLVNILAFGDSITAGVGDSQGLGGYPGRLENYFDIPVSNRGVAGERLLAEGLQRFPAVMLSSSADIVIILEGANDAIFRESQSAYRKGLQRVINVAKVLGKDVVVGTTQKPCCNKGDRGPFTDVYAKVARELSVVNEAPLADFDLAWKTTCKNKEQCELYVLPEGLHPNKTGYDVMAQVAAAALLGIDIFSPTGPTELEDALDLPKGSVIVKGVSE